MTGEGAPNLFDGPEVAQTIVACITFAGVVFTAVMANRANRNARAARDQVENDHSTNLRDDNDDKHREQKQLLITTLNLSRQNANRLRTIQADVGLLKEGWQANRDDIDENRGRIEHLESGTVWSRPIHLERKDDK